MTDVKILSTCCSDKKTKFCCDCGKEIPAKIIMDKAVKLKDAVLCENSGGNTILVWNAKNIETKKELSKTDSSFKI